MMVSGCLLKVSASAGWPDVCAVSFDVQVYDSPLPNSQIRQGCRIVSFDAFGEKKKSSQTNSVATSSGRGRGGQEKKLLSSSWWEGEGELLCCWYSAATGGCGEACEEEEGLRGKIVTPTLTAKSEGRNSWWGSGGCRLGRRTVRAPRPEPAKAWPRRL